MTTNNPEPQRAEPASLNSLFRETFDLIDEVVADTTDAEIHDRLRIVLRRAGYIDVEGSDADRLLPVGELTLAEVAALATRAHEGQREMYGAPYHHHLRVVAGALAPFGPHMEMAGWLHDILEMTGWTADQLREAGVPNRVVDIVERVTPAPGSSYLDSIRRITQDREATLVKIADNADSIYPERTPVSPDSELLLAKFELARRILWEAASPEDIDVIVRPVNPGLLAR
ncbi:hypothetical protein AB0H63_08255 [Micromonospora echinospora]|uniref:hypothetical protein n=1 Tax=Micromonospora echinospora TaxID=1877 RepID=UPI0033FDAFB0